MSESSLDGVPPDPQTGSFWEIGNYQRVLDRIDDGARLAEEFHRMLTERAELHLRFSKSLKAWKKKWEEIVEKGPEYGSAEKAMLSMLGEADKIADLHAECRNRICKEVCPSIASWRRDNYQKSMLSWKQTKQAEDGFERGQKPWAKRLEKVQRSKKSYFAAARASENSNRQLADAERDPNTSTEQCKKIKSKNDKANKERQKAEEKYRSRIEDITLYKETYERDMRLQFEKCQEFESKRLIFLRQTLLDVHRTFHLAGDSKYTSIYAENLAVVEELNPDLDLAWYSRNHGADMPMQWPQFEQFKDLDGLSRNQVSTRCIQYNDRSHRQRDSVQRLDSVRSADNGLPADDNADAGDDDPDYAPMYSVPVKSRSERTSPVSTPAADAQADNFDDPLSEERHPTEPAVADGTTEHEPANEHTQAMKVLALYDYTAQDDDELTFVEGAVILQLTEEDEQGWCKGLLDGKEGLFPANYCESAPPS